jgi:hypothetical protein
MKFLKLTWHIKNYDDKRATEENFRKKIFLGFLEGKRHYSIGRGSEYFDQRPPKGEAWDYE